MNVTQILRNLQKECDDLVVYYDKDTNKPVTVYIKNETETIVLSISCMRGNIYTPLPKATA